MDGNLMSAEIPALTEIRRVGVIGAGQMGNGIAHVCSLSGYDVVLTDVKPEALKKALDIIKRNMERQVKRSVLSERERDAALGRIKTSVDLAAVKDCDIVIEAATENEQVKRDILKALAPQLRKNAIIATNTSSISITRLAAATQRPDRVIGMHFFNPVPVMQLVELIRGLATSDETYAAAEAVSKAIGKAREGLSGRSKFVWLSENWKDYFEPIAVTAGIATLERVEVVAGLASGDQVALEDVTRKKVEKDDENN